MESLSSPKILKEVINQFNFRFNKNLGQNFLIDHNVLEKIVDCAGLDENTGVIEIGPGVGVLTQELAQKAGKVVAIELDTHLIPVLNQTMKGINNVSIIHGDALKVDMHRLIEEEFSGMKVKVVANLPYYITTPIVMELLERKLPIANIVIMIQKEVAERMAAQPGGKEYGALSVAVQYFTHPQMVATVNPHSFMPQPKVASTVIKLDILEQPSVAVNDEKVFFYVVKAAFGQRRKTLVNALSNSGFFKISKEELKELLNNMGIDEKQRGESLTIMQFAGLANAIF